MASFFDIQYCIYSDIVDGWVKKVQNFAKEIYGWCL